MSDLKSILEAALDETIESIRGARTFQELAGWDSLKYVRLVVSVQKAYGIDLQPEEIERMTSFAGLQEVLSARGVRT